jgi:hypothetical protein
MPLPRSSTCAPSLSNTLRPPVRLVVTAVFIIGFAESAWILLETPGFTEQMESSIFSVYKWVLGDTDADAIEQADIGLAFVIFGVFTLLVTVLMLNVLVAMFNK